MSSTLDTFLLQKNDFINSVNKENCNLYLKQFKGLVQNYCNYLILYKELQQFCTKPSIIIWIM